MLKCFKIAAALLLLSFGTLAQTDDDDNADNSKSKVKEMPTGIHMNESGTMPRTRKYAVLAAAPMQFTELGVGLSLSYEHSIDKNGIVTYMLPAIVTFSPTTSYQTGEHHQDPMFYFMPGLKFYPTSCYGKIKYAVGPSLVIGAGQQREDYYYSSDELHSRVIFGVMLNNSINFTLTKHVYLGVEFGLGFTYLDRYNDINQGTHALTQGGLKVGYRFK